jgi:hypothetical protein
MPKESSRTSYFNLMYPDNDSMSDIKLPQLLSLIDYKSAIPNEGDSSVSAVEMYRDFYKGGQQFPFCQPHERKDGLVISSEGGMIHQTITSHLGLP